MPKIKLQTATYYFSHNTIYPDYDTKLGDEITQH